MTGYEQIKKNEEVSAYIKKADKNLEVLGYTDHNVNPFLSSNNILPHFSIYKN